MMEETQRVNPQRIAPEKDGVLLQKSREAKLPGLISWAIGFKSYYRTHEFKITILLCNFGMRIKVPLGI